MKKQKLVAALMSIALGTSTVFSTVAFAEGTVLPNSGVEIGTTENKEVELPKGVELNWGDNTVYYNGKYYKKLQTQKDTQTQEEIQGALEAAYKDTNTTGTKEIYCKPNADVGKMTHGHVADDLIIHGNGAYVSSGERDLEIDTYKWSRATGAKDEVNGTFLEKDITVTVNNLNGIAAWGQRNTNWKITLNFENCKNMQRIYFTGTTGEIDINVNGCSFDASDDNVLKANKGTAIYSNADGSINVSNTTFKNIDVGLNLNHKMLGTQTVKIENCDFIDCGQGTKDTKTYAAPIRIVAQDGATSNLTVNKATFTYGEGVKSCNGDILLGDGRALKENEKDKKQGITTLAMENTNANVMVQNYDYYKDDGTIDSGKGETTTVKDTQIVKPNDNNHFEVEDDKPVNPPIYPIYPPTPSEPTKTEIIGDDRYETSAKIADKMGYYDTAILVNGDKSLSDGLSASSLAGKEKAPILLVKQNTIPKETLTRALKAKKIYIIGGTAAISEDVEKQLAGKEIVRVDGKNRVETSEKVAKLVGNYDEAFIVNGNTGEADAISVSSVAAKNHAPILLTNGKTSTHSKKTGVEYYVVGGDAVVSDSIVSEFDAERISGSDRYETNRAVIKEFYPNKNKYYYTKGDLLVDALAVSPLSKDNGVVLVSPKSDNSILKDKDLVQVGGMDFEINLK
ncbi:cell wall-binding repeat-containing protein [Peptacetobacter sp.]|uniref:cell wall-binding repeat-containing protein n=1 Tax=Peptacetobacter sp. TaxID=2991975 RepID=UPI003AB84DBE